MRAGPGGCGQRRVVENSKAHARVNLLLLPLLAPVSERSPEREREKESEREKEKERDISLLGSFHGKNGGSRALPQHAVPHRGVGLMQVRVRGRACLERDSPKVVACFSKFRQAKSIHHRRARRTRGVATKGLSQGCTRTL